VVDESDVFGSAGDDNDDLLRMLINTDLPSGDLDLGVWKLLAVAVLSFVGVPTFLGTSSKQQGDIAQRMLQAYVSSVSDISSGCYKCSILKLQK
jgi:hypothetical protein